ncbi:MAG: hypothetical protein NTU86_06245 [Burkholderiales bacterium]|nr:hypothetical protein [Burkholderiales bacterium]
MFSLFKKNPCEAKGNASTITSISKHLARHSYQNCVEDYTNWSQFDKNLLGVSLDSDQILEGTYYFWTFDLSLLYKCLLINSKAYSDKNLQIFVEPVFSAIYLQSKSLFIQYVKEGSGSSYFRFSFPRDEAIIDRVQRLMTLPFMTDSGANFDKNSSIGDTYSKYLEVVGFETDIEMRGRIFSHMLKSVETVMPVYAGAFKMMRDSLT